MTSFFLGSHAPFRHFLTARIASIMANNMLAVSLAWQIYDLTGSALDLGLVGLLQFLPAIPLTLVVGQLADRVDRRRLLGFCQTLLFFILVYLIHGTWRGTLDRSSLLVLSVLIGTAKAFQMPTQQALAPLVVPPEELPRALALSGSAMQFSVLLGPALGGVLYAKSAILVHSVSAGLALASALFFQLVSPRPQAVLRSPITLDSLFAGVRFVFERKVVLGAVSLDLFAVLFGGATALLPIFVREILHTGPSGLGLLRSSPAAGALIVSLIAARTPLQRNIGRLLFSSVALFGLCMIGFALSRNFALSMLLLALSGAADMISVIIRQSLVQLETPDEMRGRVSSVNTIFIGASNQLGEFESGVTAEWFGAVRSVLLGGMGTLVVVTVWLRAFPELRTRNSLRGETS